MAEADHVSMIETQYDSAAAAMTFANGCRGKSERFSAR